MVQECDDMYSYHSIRFLWHKNTVLQIHTILFMIKIMPTIINTFAECGNLSSLFKSVFDFYFYHLTTPHMTQTH